MNPQDFADSLRAQAAKMVRAHEQTLQAVAAGKKPLPQSLHIPAAALLLGLASEQKGEEALAEHRKHFLHVEAKGEHQHTVTAVLSLIHRRCVADGLDAKAHGNEILVRLPEQRAPDMSDLNVTPENLSDPDVQQKLAERLSEARENSGPDTSWLNDCVGWWAVWDKPDSETKEQHPTASRITGFVYVTINGGLPFKIAHRLVLSPYKALTIGGRKLDAEAALRGTWRDA